MVAESARKRDAAKSATSMLDGNIQSIVGRYKEPLNERPSTIVDVRFSVRDGALRASVAFYDGANAEEHLSQVLQDNQGCRDHNVEIYKTFDRSKYIFCIAAVPDFGLAVMLVKRAVA